MGSGKETTESERDPLRIGVLGDLHGHFTLALKILKRWENETGMTLDLILQVGDFGIWPYPFHKLDSATWKFSKKDPDEISFPDYMQPSEDSMALFGEDSPPEKRISAPLVFIKGNHEDFEHLSSIERSGYSWPIPVDHYSRLRYLPDGRSFCFDKDGKSILIAGIGGIDNRQSAGGFSNKAVNILVGGDRFDVMLAHEPYHGGLYDNTGSQSLLEVVSSMEPAYFFCGHHHVEGQELSQVKDTKAYILNEVNFRRKHALNRNCAGILVWNSRSDSSFSFIDEPWLKEYTRDNFRHI